MPRERDLVSLLQSAASLTPEKPLYSFLDRYINRTEAMTCAGLFNECVALASHLQRRGLNRTPVLLIQQKQSDFVKSFWACILAGAWPMPCARPRGQKWQQLAVLANQSGASAILTSSSVARLIPHHDMPEVPIIALDALVIELNNQSALSARQQWIRPSICAEDIAFIQYTSGSTSNPKGVVITHGNVMSNLAAISEAFACTDADVGLSWLPLHHDMGLIGHVLQPLYAGIHNYFLSPTDFLSDPSRWLAAISKYHVTISGGPGFAYRFCAEQPAAAHTQLELGQWRLAYCGSDRIAADVLEQFTARYSAAGFSSKCWFPCYGMAESTLYVCGVNGLTLAPDEIGNKNYVCIGDTTRLNGGADIKIVEPASGRICTDGVAGEIWISSLSVSPGYYRQSIASRQSFNQSLEGHPVYFRTGDLGFIRDKKLYFSGRLKNVIKIRGRSLHAEDIEALLQYETSDTGVQRCVAVGIQVDDVDSLVILAEHKSRRPLTKIQEKKQLERQLRNLVCDTFGVVPHSVVILPAASLPLTSSGKPVRSMCLEVYSKSLPSGCDMEVTANV